MSVVLNYLNQHFLKETWRKLSRNRQKLTPEKVVLFFGRWMEPEYEEFDTRFDDVVHINQPDNAIFPRLIIVELYR